MCLVRKKLRKEGYANAPPDHVREVERMSTSANTSSGCRKHTLSLRPQSRPAVSRIGGPLLRAEQTRTGRPGLPLKPAEPFSPGSPSEPRGPAGPGRPSSPRRPGSPGRPGRPGSPGRPGKIGRPSSPGSPFRPDRPCSRGDSGQRLRRETNRKISQLCIFPGNAFTQNCCSFSFYLRLLWHQAAKQVKFVEEPEQDV